MIKISIEVDKLEELDMIVDGYSTASDRREADGKKLADEWKIKTLEDQLNNSSNKNNFKNRKKRR